jgi:flavin reductase (DIM6/NTAB) family NADH-FMN oxidoreductase RutF
MTDDVTAFEAIVKHLEYPMFVVSVAVDDDADACLVGFTSQCSIEPPRFTVFLSKVNRTYELATRAQILVAHRLRRDQHELARHFGGTTAYDQPDKLSRCAWTPGPGGAPVIDGCDWFAGRILERVDTGDHVAFVLEPFAGESRSTEQLGSQEAFDIEAGRPVS